MNNKSSGSSSGGIFGAIAGIIACVVGGVVLHNNAPSVFKVVGWILLIAVIAIIVILIVVLVLASKAGKNTSNPATSVNGVKLDQEQSDTIKKGRSELLAIRMLVSKIKDSSITGAASPVCAGMDKILQTLKEKPDKIQTSRQFLNYYLPTVKEVLTKYQRMEASGVDIHDMPEKVTAFLNDVQEAMDNLYESLFASDVLNLEVNMEAMTLAIRRDGLLDD